MKAKPEKISIAFKYPLAPEEMRSPERIDLPEPIAVQLWSKTLTWPERQVFYLFLEETYGRSRLSAEFSYSEVSERTKLPEARVRRIVKKLENRGFLPATENF